MVKKGTHKPLIYDRNVNMRFKNETIERLKEISPNYQTTIRKLVEKYVSEQTEIENIEQQRRAKYFSEF